MLKPKHASGSYHLYLCVPLLPQEKDLPTTEFFYVHCFPLSSTFSLLALRPPAQPWNMLRCCLSSIQRYRVRIRYTHTYTHTHTHTHTERETHSHAHTHTQRYTYRLRQWLANNTFTNGGQEVPPLHGRCHPLGAAVLGDCAPQPPPLRHLQHHFQRLCHSQGLSMHVSVKHLFLYPLIVLHCLHTYMTTTQLLLQNP